MGTPYTLSRRVLCLMAVALALLPPLWGQGNQRSLFAPQKVRAVVIGISDYSDRGINDLEYAHRDAEAFAAFLLSGAAGSVEAQDIRLLTNADAKGGDVEAALNWLAENTGKGEKAIIFFSGHGENERMMARSSFLLCHNAIPRNVLSSGVLKLSALQEIVSYIAGNGADVVLVADACRAGGLLDRSASYWVGQDFGQRMERVSMLLSCRPGEQSHEGPQWGGGHGVFTHLLIQGLQSDMRRDATGRIQFKDMERFLQDTLPPLVYPKQQVPLADGDPAKVVFRVKRRDKTGNESGQLAYPQALTARNALDRAVTETADTATLRIYRQYLEALEAKRFFSPAGHCAEDLYIQLISAEIPASLLAELSYAYAVALQNDAQAALNLLLAADPQQLVMTGKAKGDLYRSYPRQLARAAELMSGESSWHRSLRARQVLFEGMLLALEARSSKNRETAEEAVRSLENALVLEPGNAVAWFYQMILQGDVLKDEEKGCRCYRQCKELAPNWILPDAYWGHYLAQTFQRMEQADTVLHVAAGIDSAHYFLFMARGSLRFAQNRNEEAIQEFERSALLFPGNYLAWNNIAATYRKLERLKEARASLERSLAIEPGQRTAYLTLGQICNQEGKFDEATDHFNKLLQLDPKNVKAMSNLALCQLDLKRWDELESTSRRIQELDPDYYLPHYLRACVALIKKDKERLCLELRQAFEKGMKLEDIHIPALRDKLQTEPCL